MTDIQESQTLAETLPGVPIPATWLYAGRSRFVNIYAPEVEQILLPAAEIAPHPVVITVRQGETWSHLRHHGSRVRFTGPRTRLRHARECLQSGRVLDLGTRLVYDGRWVYNGNLAHVLQHHAASLAFVGSRLGLAPADILVVLEGDAPPIARDLLALLGFETVQTHRAVRGRLVALQQLRDVPYHLLPYAAALPLALPAVSVPKVFIPRRGSRRLLNEAEIRQVAEAHGYRTIYMEDLPLLEQISIMRSAGSVLAVHGAALGHLAMRNTACGHAPVNLIEILSPALVTDIFRKYVAVQGGRWLGCRGTVTSRIVRVVAESSRYKSAADFDFHLDPRALEASLAAH